MGDANQFISLLPCYSTSNQLLAGGWKIIVVAFWKSLYNSVWECRKLLLYSGHIIILMASASPHLKAALFLFISTHKEPIVSTITINEMLQSLVVQFWFIDAYVCIPLFLFLFVSLQMGKVISVIFNISCLPNSLSDGNLDCLRKGASFGLTNRWILCSGEVNMLPSWSIPDKCKPVSFRSSAVEILMIAFASCWSPEIFKIIE